MLLRPSLVLIAIAALAGGAVAQTRVHTETIRRPANQFSPAITGKFQPDAAAPREQTAQEQAVREQAVVPEVLRNLSKLPPPVAAMRKRILAAARTGDPQKLVDVMLTNGSMPIFTYSQEKEPLRYWRTNYPDSGGIEVLSILTTILETGFVHVDAGTPQEAYLWPYFARLPPKSLTPEQKVELFRILTGADYKAMVEFGAYAFFRLGIAPDGTWLFFVSGD